MNFLNIAFPATSALPVAEMAIATLIASARSIVSMGAVLSLLIVFKPLLSGLLRAARLTLFPTRTREQKSARRTLRTMLTIQHLASDLDESSPAMAAELRALSGRA